MKHVTVVLRDTTPIATKGELIHDPQEGTLLVYGEGAHVTFNWDHIIYFVVAECDGLCEEGN